MQKTAMVQAVARGDVERIAHLMGEQSASARALAEFDRRTAVGENV